MAPSSTTTVDSTLQSPSVLVHAAKELQFALFAPPIHLVARPKHAERPNESSPGALLFRKLILINHEHSLAHRGCLRLAILKVRSTALVEPDEPRTHTRR